MNKCYYCGNEGKHQAKNGKWRCKKYANQCPQIKLINSENAKKAYTSGKRLPHKNIYANLSQETKDKMAWNRGNFSIPFEKNTIKQRGHKKVLIKERGHQCEKCKSVEWFDEIIPLELHHIDGDNKNQEKNNLLLLCPNCHAFTDTYRGKNSINKQKASDEQILNLIKQNYINSIILRMLNMSSSGTSYGRINKLRDWCKEEDSNFRHSGLQPDALPLELPLH